ncbi:group II intron maturase-specific domain-containing protein [Nonomuraea aurantiaca]|uniref:group II intron maturase-specific domain-containing protein n=1 Tax=Nonomuraea aurantiaca TaxID=2878562 RepID=UPI001CDA0E2A|nr:group II intron maturase-specific domain-containing protein [Nonomuraea aurantiaca]MCA2223892.1 hypothetical protein [Nonomuraea aurantiaca]
MAIRDKVRRLTHRSTRNTATDVMIRTVDRMIRGWANYFRHGVSKAVFNTLDNFVWWRLVQWIRRKHSRISLKVIRQRFCVEGWSLAYNGATYNGASSVAVVRYRYRGDRIPSPWAPQPQAH